MSVIRLKFEGKTGLTSYAPVYAEVINAELETVRELSVPVGGMVDVEVAAGRYLVRARLPSGETVSTETSVEEGAVGQAVLRPRVESPHEWLDWQFFLGNLKPQEGSLEIARFKSAWLRIWSSEQGSYSVQPWESGDKVVRWDRAGDQVVANFSLREWYPPQLRFLQVGGPQVPWRLIALPPASDLEVLVRASTDESDFDVGLKVEVATGDRSVEALLGYLASGAVPAARVVGDEVVAEQLFQAKMANPMGAAIGGYYLLRVGADQRLHDWANNFVNWIDWLPDAPVIHAWQLLRQRTGSTMPGPAIDLAGDRLLEAVERGVPVYTEGLRLLVNGLRLLKEQAGWRSSPDLTRAFQKISRYAAAADWSQPLTTFLGEDPDTPSLKAISGVPRETASLAFLVEHE
jgi:hypothetical protein